MSTYSDLLIIDDDISHDDGGLAVLVLDADCIAQDIKHMIRESGLLVQMVGQRDALNVQSLMREIEHRAEADTRLQPGTATMQRLSNNHFIFTADTVAFGPIEVSL